MKGCTKLKLRNQTSRGDRTKKAEGGSLEGEGRRAEVAACLKDLLCRLVSLMCFLGRAKRLAFRKSSALIEKKKTKKSQNYAISTKRP